MAEPCRFCGSTRFGHTNVTLDGSRVPACCWDCALCAQHMPALGHAIARFVRRSEVEDLRLTVRNAWRVGMDICKPPSPEDKRRAVVALDRLAAIALEGR